MKTFTSKIRQTTLAPRTRAAVPSIRPPLNAPVQRTQISHILHGPRVQPKLSVSAPGDRFEQEADRVANQVMRMTDDAVGSVSATAPEGIQRVCYKCQEEQDQIQRQVSDGGTPQITPPIASAINALKGYGQPLPASARSFFEPRFGADFSQVHVHTDSNADRIARSINARAFTIGNNVAFAGGQFAPASRSGNQLLAHELTHVIQQRAAQPLESRAQSAGSSAEISQQVQRADSTRIQRAHTCENDPATAPAMSCNIASTSPASSAAVDIQFGLGKSDLSPVDILTLHNVVRNWHASGGTDRIRVDGFASCDGSPGLNWPLSCDRALAVAQELLFPSDLTLTGIDRSAVEIFADGETDAFSSSLSPNRRVVVSIVFGSPPPPPATAAVFSESASQRFFGYDNSVVPNWQVVPVGETRIADVAVTPAGARPAFVSGNTAIATVTATATGIEVTGVADGNTEIEARQGATVLATLRIEVKAQRAATVDYHFMSDTAFPGIWILPAQPSHSTTRAPASAGTMTGILDRIWQRQANVKFTTGTVDSKTIPGNLGAQIVGPNTGAPEWRSVIAFGTSGDWNVFLVWEFELAASAGVDAANAGTGGSDTLLEDNDCADNLTLSHEAGHFLSGGTLPHTAAGIMGACGAPSYDRVRKAEADAANP